MSDISRQFGREVYRSLEALGADEDVLSVVGSWRDTLPDEEVVGLLKGYNDTGTSLSHAALN